MKTGLQIENIFFTNHYAVADTRKITFLNHRFQGTKIKMHYAITEKKIER